MQKDEANIKRDRSAAALVKDPSSNFWAEIKSIRRHKASHCNIVDVYSVGDEIAQLFPQKYRALYTSFPRNSVELESIVCEVENQIRENIAAGAEHLVVVKMSRMLSTSVSPINPMVILHVLLITLYMLVPTCVFI